MDHQAPAGADRHVPIYQALEKVDGDPVRLDWECYKDTLIEQAAIWRRADAIGRRRASAACAGARRERPACKFPIARRPRNMQTLG